MVRSRALGRDLRRSIFKTMGRFLAILAIIALGSGFLAGLRCTKAAMVETMQRYVDAQSLFDLRVLSTYGFTQEDADALADYTGARAEGAVSLDALVKFPESEEDQTVRFFSLPEGISLPELTAGRMPSKPGECLVDAYIYGEEDLGTSFSLAKDNDEETTEKFAADTFTIVGICRSPLFMSFERGTTSIGKGILTTFCYVPMDTFQMDGIYTEIDLKLPENGKIYTEAYNDRLQEFSDLAEPKVAELALQRQQDIKSEALDQLAEGWREYSEGVWTYNREKADAMKQLDDARSELDNGWAEWNSGRAKLTDGYAQMEQGRQKLKDSETQIAAGYEELKTQEVEVFQTIDQTEADLLEKRQQAQAGLPQIEDGLSQINDGLSQIESGLQQLDALILPLQGALYASREELITVESMLEERPYDPALLLRKSTLESQISGIESQLEGLQEKRAPVAAQQSDLQNKKADLEQKKRQLNDGLSQIEAGLQQLPEARIQARKQLDDARKELDNASAQVKAGWKELEDKKNEAAQAELDLEAAHEKLLQGEDDYEKGYDEAMAGLDDGWKKVQDGKLELERAQREIDKLEKPQHFLLDRNTNVAYVTFDSDSSIVEGVARVFPLFFFAVAALVCLTTMSKMVDEERTQIGVKKALGYSVAAISMKYLMYAGIATLVGCMIGVTVGSFLFPAAIWQGYRILYQYSPKIYPAMDVPMSILIVVAFTGLMLLVTWYCCRRELREVPAELIRPKAPKAGKHLILEKMFFWKRLSFLKKVSIRNVFRYHKRLIMMLMGVGGCAAMLVTGYGIRDTITGIADYQFDHIAVFDASAVFQGNQSPEAQQRFRENLEGQISASVFLHEQPMDITVEDKTKALQMMVTDQSLEGFWVLQDDNGPLPMPGKGETLLSEGLADRLQINPGDTVTLTSTDLKTMELTVSGIFHNNVQNYAIIHPATMEDQWGENPEINSAYLNFPQEADIHAASAEVFTQEDVLNVTPTEDVRSRVDNMLVSLDYIVALVVGCAAALAFIVMYNLTNINITERIREIATIKVLGFYSGESALYVFREGMMLTLMGCAIGLVAGKFLNDFVISQIKVDAVFFIPKVSPVSYTLAVVLTILFALVVDFALYFKLEKINMAEALKSVE